MGTYAVANLSNSIHTRTILTNTNTYKQGFNIIKRDKQYIKYDDVFLCTSEPSFNALLKHCIGI